MGYTSPPSDTVSPPLVYLVIIGMSSDPRVIWSGWMNISGAQYDARFWFPSKMVLINGNPNASVFCEAQNIAATTSGRENSRKGAENILNNAPKEAKWSVGNRVRRTKLCLSSSPKPLENALQNAFQTIPNRMIWGGFRRGKISYANQKNCFEGRFDFHTSWRRFKLFEFLV